MVGPFASATLRPSLNVLIGLAVSSTFAAFLVALFSVPFCLGEAVSGLFDATVNSQARPGAGRGRGAWPWRPDKVLSSTFRLVTPVGRNQDERIRRKPSFVPLAHGQACSKGSTAYRISCSQRAHNVVAHLCHHGGGCPR